MKYLDKNILLSWVLLVALILPMGIGMAHAFHQHKNELCLEKNESHYHSEKTNCNQLHYFCQTLHDGEIAARAVSFPEIFDLNKYYSEFNLIHSFSKADPDRGPPVIDV